MTNAMILNEMVLGAINAVKAGTMGVVVTMQTIPTWKSVKASLNPYLGRVEKRTRIANCALGICYTNAVQSHAEQCGVDTSATPYVPSAPKGMHYPSAEEHKYLVSNTNEEQMYLNICYRGNESVTNEFYLDGALVEDSAVIEDIWAHIRTSTPCAKQTTYGVAEDMVVKVNRPKFQNILSITQGERVQYYRDKVGEWSEVL